MNLRDDDLNNLCIVADCISVCCTVNESELDFFYHASVGVLCNCVCAWLCDCVCFYMLLGLRV